MDEQKIRNMEEFAAVSGISRPTLSKYFQDPESVRRSTRAKIEKAVEQYDFRPNLFAMNQNRRLTRNIGIVVPYLADPFFAEIARLIERRCLRSGYFPMLFSSHGQLDLELKALDSLQSLKPAGALIAPLGRFSDPKVIEKFCAAVPTILFDSDLKDLGGGFVGSDNSQTVALIVEYLCRTGEPPCFFEMETPVNPNARKRRHAYIQTMERLGFAPEDIRIEGSTWDFEEIGYLGGMKVIEERRLPSDTILCSNDRLAIGLLSAAFEKGLRVGRGTGCALRIAGHDDHPFSRFTCPPLTTISQDYSAIADCSFEALIDLINGEGDAADRKTTLFEGKLVMRSSA